MFTIKEQRFNVSIILYHETNTKNLRIIWSIAKQNFYESELEKLPKPSADPQYKGLKYTLNSINVFLLLLVISFMGSKFEIFGMSLYTSMKPFRDNLE